MTTIQRVLAAGAAFVLASYTTHCATTDPGTSGLDMGPHGDLAMAVAPILTQVSPALTSNQGGAALTITGSGFVAGATVTIAGVSATSVVVVSSTQITCVAPAKAMTCGPVQIVVKNPNNQTGTADTLLAYKSTGFGYQAAVTTTAGAIATARNIVSADFNSDGKPDLAISNFGSGAASTVSVLLGMGGSGFGTPATATVGTQPRGLAAGDFNGDKMPDLLVANSGSNNFHVLINQGGGIFVTRTPVAGGIGANAAAVGDFDGDGKLDAVIASAGTAGQGGTVKISLGVGDGTFKIPAVNLGTGFGANSVVVRDFNGDGKLDVAAASSNGIDVFLGDGMGGFGAAVNFAAGTSLSELGAADFDGNQKPDLFAINTGTNNLTVLLNQGGAGTGLFGSAKGVQSGGTTPGGVVAADFDGDGKPDLATVNSGSTNVSVLLGSGTGTFAQAQVFAVTPAQGPGSLVATDLNGDGTPDVVTSNNTSGNISVLLSQCN